MGVYVTHCDRRYVSRAIAMAKSLLKHESDSRIIVICQDRESREAFSKFDIENIELFMISDLIECFPNLREARKNRSLIEFYYCLSPFIIKFGLSKYPEEIVSYVDADIYFFNGLSKRHNYKKPNFSVRIISHRFKPEHSYLEKYGKFNVGIVEVNPEYELIALDWWAASCLKSTSVIPTENSFGDQKYLDYFENVDPNSQASFNAGENVAPWNLVDSEIAVHQGSIRVVKDDLIYFHFSGLKLFRYFTVLGFAGYNKAPGSKIWRTIYRPYILELREIEKQTGEYSTFGIRTLSLKLWLREIYYRDIRCFS